MAFGIIGGVVGQIVASQVASQVMRLASESAPAIGSILQKYGNPANILSGLISPNNSQGNGGPKRVLDRIFPAPHKVLDALFKGKGYVLPGMNLPMPVPLPLPLPVPFLPPPMIPGLSHILPFIPGCGGSQQGPGSWIDSEQAGQEYGNVTEQLSSIVHNPNLSLEEKVVLMAGLMADELDKQAEQILDKWGQQLQRTSNQGEPTNAMGMGPGGGGGFGGFGGFGGGGGAGGAGGQSNDASFSQYHQVQVQRILQKKNQMISLASNVSKSEHDTKKGVIQNMRV